MSQYITMRYLFILIILFLPGIARSQPDASFTLSKNKICSGTKVIFTNTTTGATNYSWFVNGIFFSNNIHDSTILTEPCYDLQTIKLVATNTSGVDSLVKTVEVFDTCALHLHGDYTNCVGDTIRKKAHPDAISNTWSITPAHTLIEGCFTCDSITFVLAMLGTDVELNSTYEGGCSQPVSYHYPSCNPLIGTGIGNYETSKINIYPNPATDVLNVDAGSYQKITKMLLYNSYGSLLTVQQPTATTLDVSQLSHGIYFLRIELLEETIIKKFLKE